MKLEFRLIRPNMFALEDRGRETRGRKKGDDTEF